MGLSGYLSSGAELGNMTGKAFLSLLGTLAEEVGVFALSMYRNFKNRRNGEKSIGGGRHVDCGHERPEGIRARWLLVSAVE